MSPSSRFTLLSPSQAGPLLAQVLQSTGECTLFVSEERAFKGEWLSLGCVSLVASDLGEASPVEPLQHGAFEWRLPELTTAITDTTSLLGLNGDDARVRNAMDEVASIATRVGLVHPRFDPAALEQMPFRHSTTVVVDTSGVGTTPSGPICGPAHLVRLLTADQGLARMAMTEGVPPLYFGATRATDVFGQRLAGQTFHPFDGNLRSTPLTTLVWELATSFGSARLQSGPNQFQVSAIGEHLPWAPYHAEQDLLWCLGQGSPPVAAKEKVSSSSSKVVATTDAERVRVPVSTPPARQGMSFLRLNVDRLFRVVCALDDVVDMPVAQAERLLGSSSNEYRRFLHSGGFINPTRRMWTATRLTQSLSAALRNERINEVKEALLEVPSFAAFADRLRDLAPGEPLAAEALGRGATTYRTLGEVTLICAAISGKGIYPTPNAPEPDEFSCIALNCFSALDREGGGLVATGEWLEALIQHEGIHPEVARRQLDAASEAGLLRRSTEGSTTQLRFGDRVLHVLRTESGLPTVERVFLYRGDYLIPGKASVSLRIEDPRS